MKSTFSIILSLLLAAISTSSGFVGNNNNPPIRVTSRLFEGEEDTTTTTTTPANKPTSRPDFEFSFEVPKKGIGEYIIIRYILLLIYFVLCTFIFFYLHLT